MRMGSVVGKFEGPVGLAKGFSESVDSLTWECLVI